MACMMSDKAGPLLPPQFQQKRCSLPGPGLTGTLNLYASHQQRRLSDRGLMVYRPSKPDIDLIGEFINPNKKLTKSSGNTGSTSALLPTIPSPSKSPCKSNISSSTSFFFPHTLTSSSSITSTSTSSVGCRSSKGNNEDGNVLGQSTSSNNNNRKEEENGGTNNSLTSLKTTPSCRKVRLRIQKNSKDRENKVLGMQAIGLTGTPLYSPSSGLSSMSSPPILGDVSGADDEEHSLLCHPLFDARRFSDSAACRPPPEISISVDAESEDMQSGIVCSTGDLLTLKCLTSSAQEIRYYKSQYGVNEMSPPAQQLLGNRSRSFDATYAGVTGHGRKCAGSSWFSRRHLPISIKLPIPLKSPSAPNSPGPNQLQMKTPLLTVTNETSGESEIIEVPSPPAVTPASSGNSPDEKQKVAWDKSGFVLDPAVLGFAIENHLRKIDMGRRATVSTLYQQPNTLLDSQVTTRARSASACVIPNPGSVPLSTNLGSILLFGNSSSIGSSGSSTVKPGVVSTGPTPSSLKSTSRRTSLQTTQRLPFSYENCDPFLSKEKRPSLSLVSSTSIKLPTESSLIPTLPNTTTTTINSTRVRSHSYVETIDPNNGRTKTTTQSSFLKIGCTGSSSSSSSSSRMGKTFHHQSRGSSSSITGSKLDDGKAMGMDMYKKTNETNHTGGGVSICTAIRDFIFQSLRS